jgi:molybdopterin biosynthesis enzyme
MNIQTLKEASDCLLNLAKPETQPIERILLQDAFERILAEDITDLKDKLGKMVVAYTYDGKRI